MVEKDNKEKDSTKNSEIICKVKRVWLSGSQEGELWLGKRAFSKMSWHIERKLMTGESKFDLQGRDYVTSGLGEDWTNLCVEVQFVMIETLQKVTGNFIKFVDVIL